MLSKRISGSILIIAAEDIIVRNILDTEVWEALAPSLEGVSVTLVVPKGRAQELRERFPQYDLHEFTRVAPSRIDALLSTLLYACLPTHTNHWSKMRAYLRGHASFFATYAKRLHAATLGRVHGYQWLLRRLYRRVGQDAAAQALFEAVRPMLVISLSVTNFDTDVVLMREAQRRGIRVVGMTRSWDNLTSHGALRVVPDQLIVQNTFLRDAVRGVQGVSPRHAAIAVVGLPHYDVARRAASFAGTREAFCHERGLDPAKQILLYGAMGTFLFIREHDLIPMFSKLVTEGALGVGQVLYRPHPKFPIPEEMQNLPGVTIDRTGTYRTGTGDERSASEALFRSIYHADVVATGASTFAIDAALLDKPVVCIAFDGSARKGEVRYWESVERFYDRYTHFEELLAQGGVQVVRSPEALRGAVKRYLVDPTLEQEGRARIVERFVGAVDGHASKRLASILAAEVSVLS